MTFLCIGLFFFFFPCIGLDNPQVMGLLLAPDLFCFFWEGGVTILLASLVSLYKFLLVLGFADWLYLICGVLERRKL